MTGPGNGKAARRIAGGLVLIGVLAVASSARGQGAVAFAPIPGAVFDGSALSVTPVVTADRRYVRLGLRPTFQTIGGFDTFPVPAAVAGGGIGGGVGLPGLGGGGGGPGLGGGAGGGGLRNVGIGGTAPKAARGPAVRSINPNQDANAGAKPNAFVNADPPARRGRATVARGPSPRPAPAGLIGGSPVGMPAEGLRPPGLGLGGRIGPGRP